MRRRAGNTITGRIEVYQATPMVAGAAVAAAAIAGRYGIHSWQAFKARPIVPRMRKFYEERQGGELKGVDMLLLDAKVIKKIIIFKYLEIQTRWPQSSRGQSTFKLSSLFQHILQEGLVYG
ncbi:unnamed protein product, partial [Brassica rapa subsp. trilocularis]